MARKKSKLDFKKIAIDALALSGGAAVSGIVDGMLLSKLGNLDTKIKGLIKVGAGAVMPQLLAPGNRFIERFGDGVVAVGGYQLLHSLLPGQIPAIEGVGNINSYPPQIEMNGLPTVSGDLDLSTVSGVQDEVVEEGSFFE